MDEFTPLNLFGDDETAGDKGAVDSAEVKNEETVAEDTTGDVPVGDDEVTSEVETDEVVYSEETEITAKEDGTSEEVEVSEVKTEEPDRLDKVAEVQEAILEKLEALDKLFTARIMHTDHEEKIVDQMHKELQKYKEDMYSQLVRPILMDVIEVRDSIMRMAATYLAKPEGEQSIPNKTFSDYAYDLQDILEKNSVEIYRSKSGDDFTPLKQRVVKKVATSDETLHGKVADSLSCGYSYNGRTISAEKITVYFYEKPVENNENSEVIENG